MGELFKAQMRQIGAIIGLLLIGLISLVPASAIAQNTSINSNAQTVNVPPPAVEERLAQYEARLAAKYEARIDAMAMNRKSFDDFIQAATWIGALASVLLIGFSFFIGKSVTEVQSIAKNAANDAFSNAFREHTAQGKTLQELIGKAKETSESLSQMRDALKGYTDLADTAKSASGFDPLIGHFSIDNEIDKRDDCLKKMRRGDERIALQDTTLDSQFRQRAALIFEKLLDAVREDMKSGKTRFRSSILYNAAANASKINMDFVALELTEAAFASDTKSAPELEARLIRQRISMSRITPDAALTAIKSVLTRVNGFNVHLVSSEAFNIAQYLSNPVEMALMIADNVRSELKNTSCVLLNGARLLLLGDKQQDWNLGACWYMRGLVALSEESPSARWIESSYGDVAAILQERPDFFEAYRTELMSAIGTAMDAKALTRKIGIRLAGVFEEFDVSQWFLQAPVNSGNSGDSA